MSQDLFRCPLCGFRFDPAANPACGQCPLHQGCTMVCCPNCGHSTINPGRSRLGKLAGSLWGRGRMRRDWGRRRAHGRGRGEWGCARCLSLAQAPVGSWARVINLDSLPANRKLQLQAMGISPGRRALVQQQEPVTIVLCGQAEIALESELAGSVLVELTD